MTKKVLLLSSSFMGLCDNIASAFRKRGYDVTLEKRKEPNQHFLTKVLSRFLSFLSKTNRHLEKEGIKELSVKAKEYVCANPDAIVIDYLGINLDLETLVTIREKHSFLIKLMGDSVESYPFLKNTLKYYDLVITYESEEVSRIRKYTSADVILVPACFDETIFRPAQDSSKTIDVCFVGKLFSKEHKKRRKTLEKLRRDFPSLHFEIYGIYAKRYQVLRYLMWKIRDGGNFFVNRNISQQEVNCVYNRSRIVLNLNSFQTHDNWSSRLVEILGSGANCISEFTPKSYEAFASCCHFFRDYKQLCSLINDCMVGGLEHQSGRELVVQKYSMTNYTFVIESAYKKIKVHDE